MVCPRKSTMIYLPSNFQLLRMPFSQIVHCTDRYANLKPFTYASSSGLCSVVGKIRSTNQKTQLEPCHKIIFCRALNFFSQCFVNSLNYSDRANLKISAK